MVSSSVRLCELSVMLFQVAGVAALCLSRLFPGGEWEARGRVGFVVALFGLGVTGALCGMRDSEFGLFAGLTMTGLLIGMTMGGGHAAPSRTARTPATAETALAA